MAGQLTPDAPAADQALPPPGPRSRRRRRRRDWRTIGAAYLFISPFLISFGLFFLGPSIYSVILSLFDYNGYAQARYIGLANYQHLLHYPVFWSALSNTLFYLLAPAIPLLGGAFLIAVAVNSRLMRWGRTFKPLIFLPQIMAPVAAALVWRVVFSTNSGLINQLDGLHTGWLTNPSLMKISVSMLLVWRGLGWFFIIMLAGLTRIPKDLYEAAEVDGASAYQRLVHITIPMMRPIFLFVLVIHTVGSLRLFAEPNLLITGSQSPDSTPQAAAPLMNLLITNVSDGAFGLASALGWLLFLLIGALSLAQFRLFRERA